MEVRYPNVKVKLVGVDGNAYSVMGTCADAARRAGVSEDEIERFHEECTSGDYDHLLQTCMRWFDCH